MRCPLLLPNGECHVIVVEATRTPCMAWVEWVACDIKGVLAEGTRRSQVLDEGCVALPQRRVTGPLPGGVLPRVDRLVPSGAPALPRLARPRAAANGGSSPVATAPPRRAAAAGAAHSRRWRWEAAEWRRRAELTSLARWAVHLLPGRGHILNTFSQRQVRASLVRGADGARP